MNRLRLSGLIVLGVVAALCSGETAWAQPVISGTFYEELKASSCNNSTSCVIEFTPPTTRVLFSKVTCTLYKVKPSATLTALEMSIRDTSGGQERRTEGIPFNSPAIDLNGVKHYITSASLDFLFAPSKIPAVHASFDDISGTLAKLSCKITGRIQP